MSDVDLNSALKEHYTVLTRDITPEKTKALYGHIYNLLHDAMREQREINTLDFLGDYQEIQRRQIVVDVKKQLAADMLRILD